MASNFKFLEKEFPDLAEIGAFAEEYLHSDPNSTLTKLRLLCERITGHLLRFENLPLPSPDTQRMRLKRMESQGFLPPSVRQGFHTIKNKGDTAVREGAGAPNDAKACLALAFKISVWFGRVYGENISVEKREFVVPKKKERKADIVQREAAFAKKLAAAAKSEAASPPRKKPVKEGVDPAEQDRIISFQPFKDQKINEGETRLLIDEQLRKCGWEADTERIRYPRIKPEKGKNRAIAEWPCKTGKRADYALFSGLKLIGIIEAKKSAADAVSHMEQAKTYARTADLRGDAQYCDRSWSNHLAPFVFAANGRPYFKQLEEKSGIWFLDVAKKGNIPRALRNWPSPRDLEERLEKNEALAEKELKDLPYDSLRSPYGLGLYDFQVDAVRAVEDGLRAGKTSMLVAMATGTGKTRTAVGLIYRLLDRKRFRRILFLVDREALGDQAWDDFRDKKILGGDTLNTMFDIKEPADKVPEDDTRLQVATVQGMVKRTLYNEEGVGEGMPTPGQYDCVIVDEAHRGYIPDKDMDEDEFQFKNQKDYIGKYRTVLEYFDAVKIALTATPALHTVEIFGEPVFTYTYRQAVIGGYLTDHEPPYVIETRLKQKGIHFKKRESVDIYDREEKEIKTVELAEDVDIDIGQFNKKAITKPFNKAVAGELAKHLHPQGDEKTLIFCVSDEHADLVVLSLKEAFKKDGLELDDGAIMKITGSVAHRKDLIRRFKNETEPNIVATVDLLTTGVDVPAISNLVFLRATKSRILYEQMLGRAARLCPRIDKEYFSVFDAVGVYDALAPYTAMKPVTANPKITFQKLIEEAGRIEIPARKQQQLEQILAKLRRKSARIKKAKKEDSFAVRAEGKKPAEYIAALSKKSTDKAFEQLNADSELFRFLDEESFLPNIQYISYEEDKVLEVTRNYGKAAVKPGDYLEEFQKFVAENRDKIKALGILCKSPSKITREQLREIKLLLDEKGFSDRKLNVAYGEVNKQSVLANIVGFIRNAAEGIPLASHAARVKTAVDKARRIHSWNAGQIKWLDRIEKQLLQEDIVKPEDFEREPFKGHGGFRRIDKVLDGRLESVIDTINQHLYEAA